MKLSTITCIRYMNALTDCAALIYTDGKPAYYTLRRLRLASSTSSLSPSSSSLSLMNKIAYDIHCMCPYRHHHHKYYDHHHRHHQRCFLPLIVYHDSWCGRCSDKLAGDGVTGRFDMGGERGKEGRRGIGCHRL